MYSMLFVNRLASDVVCPEIRLKNNQVGRVCTYAQIRRRNGVVCSIGGVSRGDVCPIAQNQIAQLAPTDVRVVESPYGDYEQIRVCQRARIWITADLRVSRWSEKRKAQKGQRK